MKDWPDTLLVCIYTVAFFVVLMDVLFWRNA
jgi:hypothetical protein